MQEFRAYNTLLLKNQLLVSHEQQLQNTKLVQMDFLKYAEMCQLKAYEEYA